MKIRSFLLVIAVTSLFAPSAKAQAGFHPPPPGPSASAPGRSTVSVTGIVGNDLFLRGRFAGRLDHDRINCLGHAAGVNASVQTGTLPIDDTLRALGYSCKVGAPESLAGAIASGKPVMMVYLYTYPDSFRPEADRGLSAAQMAARYRWKKEPWRQHAIFSNDEGDLPFDFHAIGYDRESESWSWVTHARPKDGDGHYSVDSSPDQPATRDPELYFPVDHVMVKLACVAEKPAR